MRVILSCSLAAFILGLKLKTVFFYRSINLTFQAQGEAFYRKAIIEIQWRSDFKHSDPGMVGEANRQYTSHIINESKKVHIDFPCTLIPMEKSSHIPRDLHINRCLIIKFKQRCRDVLGHSLDKLTANWSKSSEIQTNSVGSQTLVSNSILQFHNMSRYLYDDYRYFPNQLSKLSVVYIDGECL